MIRKTEMVGVAVKPLSVALEPGAVSLSLTAASREAYEALWKKDPLFRAYIGSLSNDGSQTSSLQQDHAKAATAIYQWLRENRQGALQKLGHKAEGWVRRHLQDLKKHFKHDKQHRWEEALRLRDQRTVETDADEKAADEAA